MENNKKSNTKSLQKEITKEQLKEIERAAILKNSNNIKDMTIDFDIETQKGIEKEISDIKLGNIDDPESKYNLYYNVVRRLLLKHLPKGEENKKARDIVYEEKSIFLNRGHKKNKNGIRGSDERMAYTDDINELINIITEWIASKNTMFELYTDLKDLNISKGYRK